MQSWGWDTPTIKGEYVYTRQSPLGTIIKCWQPKNISLEDLEHLAYQSKAFQTILYPYPTNDNTTQYSEYNYIPANPGYETTATSLVDITPPEDGIVKAISKTARQIIKKVLPSGTSIRLDSDNNSISKLKDFYQLYNNIKEKKQFLGNSYGECQKIYLSSPEETFFISGYYNKDLIASAWFILIKNTLIYFKIGLTPKAYETQINYHILFEAIKYAKTKGATVLDLNAIYDWRYPNQKDFGYTNFKKHFHGQEVYYPPPVYKLYNPIYRGIAKCFKLFSY